MTSYIVPYKPGAHSRVEDPLFSEYTYGNGSHNALNLKKVMKGDYLFFTKTIERYPCITAFYEVEKIAYVRDAKMDDGILKTYKNHHLFKNEVNPNEVIVFGNPKTSMVLDDHLPVTRSLLEELSIPYKSSPNHNELQSLTLKIRWKSLTDTQVKKLLTKINPLYDDEFLTLQKELSSTLTLDNTEKETIVKARIGQSLFKKALLMKETKCGMCGVSDARLLVASHIKPWSQSTHKERLDVNNGLLLCPNHDALFDKGYISFDEDGKLMVSEGLDDSTKELLHINENMKIHFNDGERQYMKWHREKKLKKAQLVMNAAILK